ncbi:GNAT superfamily N-acetyltransferase [Agromyces terreus]|uniref:GNAT superfamily N-acetyltransferase n=1 Tax=Agromyces terreus TaxID=424795 RepID=A0A9X2GXP5_9MICO|nr:GNAT family N-acetyltransferase [Agromyces terreus]MCP2370537.1 GNAT superfamily N-acetyltransferase [Agromyces terreus]
MTQVSPDEISLDPKSPDEVVAWLPVAMREYEESRLEAGDSAEGADAARAESEQRFFPGGRLIEGHLLFTIRLAGEEVGWFWLGPWNGTGTEDWWIYDIRVYEEFQRRGIARIVMQRADEIARGAGAKSLGLNAFAVNLPAITLYQSLGYLTTSLHMRKTL